MTIRHQMCIRDRFMAQNTVFLLMTALIRNFYKAIMQRLKTREFGLDVYKRQVVRSLPALPFLHRKGNKNIQSS